MPARPLPTNTGATPAHKVAGRMAFHQMTIGGGLGTTAFTTYPKGLMKQSSSLPNVWHGVNACTDQNHHRDNASKHNDIGDTHGEKFESVLMHSVQLQPNLT